jgi:hypothetical protein
LCLYGHLVARHEGKEQKKGTNGQEIKEAADKQQRQALANGYLAALL